MPEAETVAYLFRKAGQRLEGCEGLLEVDDPLPKRREPTEYERGVFLAASVLAAGGTLKLKHLGHLARWVADMIESGL
jgi:hypothetical protein